MMIVKGKKRRNQETNREIRIQTVSKVTLELWAYNRQKGDTLNSVILEKKNLYDA